MTISKDKQTKAIEPKTENIADIWAVFVSSNVLS